MDNLIEVEYREVKAGQEFKITKYDHRVYRKERNGALQIKDSYGEPCADRDYHIYGYQTMPVWVEQEESEGSV